MDQVAKPTWRKVVDFPLVTLVIAVVSLILAVGLTQYGFAMALGQAGYIDPKHISAGLAKAPFNYLIAALEVVVSVVVYKFFIARLGEHPRDDLRLAPAGRDSALGALFGLVLFTLIVGVAAAVGVYRIVGQGDTSGLMSALVFTALMPGFREELLFRGVLFRWIEEFGGSWFALFVTSALFGLAHIMNPAASAFSSFAIAVEAGLLLGGAYMLTRSLWLPMALHAAWNFTQGEIWDVPVSGFDSHGLVEAKLSGPELVSGGSFGLEASVIALVIATAAGVCLTWRAVRKGELMHPWWVRRRLEREQVTVPATADA